MNTGGEGKEKSWNGVLAVGTVHAKAAVAVRATTAIRNRNHGDCALPPRRYGWNPADLYITPRGLLCRLQKRRPLHLPL